MSNNESDLFNSQPLRAELLQALESVNYQRMTPVQTDSLGPILDGRDLLAQAETGSGKTAAFAIGILNRLNINMFKTKVSANKHGLPSELGVLAGLGSSGRLKRNSLS